MMDDFDDRPEEFEETEPERPEVISESHAINLTCTLASLSALFALFLLFADQENHAVRRFAVQSVGLGALHLALGMACWLLSVLFGWVPLVGYLLSVLVGILFFGATVCVAVIRVRMMLRAYRGEAYVLPGIGGRLRGFE